MVVTVGKVASLAWVGFEADGLVLMGLG
jgi:hypothetical protein